MLWIIALLLLILVLANDTARELLFGLIVLAVIVSILLLSLLLGIGVVLLIIGVVIVTGIAIFSWLT